MSAHAPHPRRRRTVGIWVVAASVVGLLIFVSWTFLRDTRVDLQPEDFVGAEDQAPSIALLAGATDVTAMSCDAEIPCVSAWGTADMVLMKFDTQDAAAAAARALGSGAYRSDWLVASFIGESVSETERRHAAEVLDGTWQDHVD